MPVYLFTFHAYRSWMPDHKRGFVRRKEGVLPPNRAVSNIYKQQALADEVGFDERLQRSVIDELKCSCTKQTWQLHFVSTDITHVHALVSWRSNQTWMQVRTSLKSSLSRNLNREHGKRPWFSEGASRKQVRDEKHFNHLVKTYLPKHTGLKWQEKRGLFK